MKKVAILAMSLLAAAVSYGQGTVNFANAGAWGSAPGRAEDGTTLLSGARYMAELMAGTSAGSLTAVGSPTPFLTGGGAGFFNGGVITIASVTPGATAFFQVRAWDTTRGTSFALAQAAGAGWALSNVFSGATGGAGTPPSSPGSMNGLTAFTLVPEPSSYALLALGGAAMFFRRRK